MKYIAHSLAVILLLTGCSFKAGVEWQAYTKEISRGQHTTKTINEDMRNPDTRAAVDELITQNALSDRNDPMPAPDTAFDIPLPDGTEGMSCEQPSMEGNPQLPVVTDQSSPVITNEALLQSASFVMGVPDWYDRIQPLECNIEAPLPKEAVHSWIMTTEDNPRWVVGFDRDGDGKVDATIEVTSSSPFPRFYGFIRNATTRESIIYIDTRQDGSCDGIDRFQYNEGVLKPKDMA